MISFSFLIGIHLQLAMINDLKSLKKFVYFIDVLNRQVASVCVDEKQLFAFNPKQYIEYQLVHLISNFLFQFSFILTFQNTFPLAFKVLGQNSSAILMYAESEFVDNL